MAKTKVISVTSPFNIPFYEIGSMLRGDVGRCNQFTTFGYIFDSDCLASPE